MDKLIFRYMTLEDLPYIMLIEQDAFSTPWTAEAFHNELTNNRLAHYMIAELDGEIIGYAGMWLIIDEAHITNIAIRSSIRGKGIGKKLVAAVMDTAKVLGALKMTLEVRINNVIAQHVYKTRGFVEAGIRPSYYEDNGEDALIMWATLVPEEHEANVATGGIGRE